MDPITIGIIVLVVVVPGILLLVISSSKKAERERRVALAGMPAPDRYNNLAIVAFVLAFFASLPAVILGHLALSAINRTHERGRGLAIAALWLGYLGIVGGIGLGIVTIIRLL